MNLAITHPQISKDEEYPKRSSASYDRRLSTEAASYFASASTTRRSYVDSSIPGKIKIGGRISRQLPPLLRTARIYSESDQLGGVEDFLSERRLDEAHQGKSPAVYEYSLPRYLSNTTQRQTDVTDAHLPLRNCANRREGRSLLCHAREATGISRGFMITSVNSLVSKISALGCHTAKCGS